MIEESKFKKVETSDFYEWIDTGKKWWQIWIPRKVRKEKEFDYVIEIQLLDTKQ